MHLTLPELECAVAERLSRTETLGQFRDAERNDRIVRADV
jgi:hypothetical protein